MKRTGYQYIGMALFTVAVCAFVSLTFWVKGEFSEQNLSAVVGDKRGELLASLSNLPELPPAQAVFAVRDAIDSFNQTKVAELGISESQSNAILTVTANNPSQYSEALLTQVLGAGTRRRELVMDYTGWMIGREWSSTEFESTLKAKISEVNATIVEEFGVGSGSRDELISSILTAATPEWIKSGWMALLIFGLAAMGGLVYIIPDFSRKPGIHNNGIYHNKMQTRQWPAWIVFAFLVGWYIVLYQFPSYLANQIALLEPLSRGMSGGASSRWFLYGFMYCLAMLVLGIRMMVKYRGNAYQQVRTVSVLFFQLVFAFTLPQIMTRLQLPAYDLKSAWPLEYSFFFDYRIAQMLEAGTLGLFLFVWGIVLFAIGVPLLTYFYGKRWYCSWVCGCGGLAETVGDPYRHLSDKRLGAWKIERWLVHGVLVFAVVMTALVLYTSITGEAELLGMNSYSVRSTYGFFIGFVFAGAVGTGFYPVMGSRVWCRFGCPLAAYLGLVQRFKSRFRITTNGGQCISCGNCSTYCEMGIDVRWYAQRGQNIVRSSCVGCGVCSAVCPRGVLKLENGSESGRINDNPILIGRDRITLNLD
jgi:polyferredoxin